MEILLSPPRTEWLLIMERVISIGSASILNLLSHSFDIIRICCADVSSMSLPPLDMANDLTRQNILLGR